MTRQSLKYILILLLLIILFFFDIIFLGKTLSTSSILPGATLNGPYGFSGHRPDMPFCFDTGGNAWVNEPNPHIIKNILKQGRLPLWNPREGLGMPVIGNLNTEALNPLKLFLNLFPSQSGYDAFFLLRLFFMGVFTYLFLRETGLGGFPALFGSAVFMLSGYSVWWINLHPLSTVMFIPAVFYFYERWRNKRGRLSPLFMSLSIAFALLGGKLPDVIMGLSLLFPYALWKGLRKESLKGLCREGGKVIIGTVSGALMASLVLLPFIELYSRASPLARAIRTGAASHSIPMISSVSLFQPLFLGWGNYFHESWLKWSPEVILPHASLVVIVLSLYCILNRRTLVNTVPYLIFSVFLFSMVYGLLPNHIISRLPVLGSIEFLKYNSMLYFSLAVMSATALDHLLSMEGKKKMFYLSIVIVSMIILVCFFSLYETSPQQMKGYMKTVLFFTLCGLIVFGLCLHFSKNRRFFGISVFVFLILELFLYMPKDRPDRFEPYKEPPYFKALKEDHPYRVIGSGNIVPPLVSSAMGLNDARAMNVLLPNDYYIFFQHLISFSVPLTNNPDPLIAATSRFSDLLGVKYILSNKILEPEKIESAVETHVRSLRWIRLFEAMKTHRIKGGAAYGFFSAGGQERFSFLFPLRFRFDTRIKVTEPYIFAGFALKNMPGGTSAKVRIAVGEMKKEMEVGDNQAWNDLWIDVHEYMGQTAAITIEGEGQGSGSIVLGDFGLSPGGADEKELQKRLLSAHKAEFDFIEYRGAYEGIHVYENRNVMGRAFLLHDIRHSGSLKDAINELQAGIDFRNTALVSDSKNLYHGAASKHGKVSIKKYSSDKIVIDVESRGGLLVLSDLYYPGWKVKVNGKRGDVVKVFGIMRGVMLEEGKTEVVFYYRPASLYAGAAVSLSAFVLLLWFLYYRKHSEDNA